MLQYSVTQEDYNLSLIYIGNKYECCLYCKLICVRPYEVTRSPDYPISHKGPIILTLSQLVPVLS